MTNSTLTSYVQIQSSVYRLVRAHVSDSSSSKGRCKPTELAYSIVNLVRNCGILYFEDIKAAFDALPEPTGRRNYQVKWESVVTAIRSAARGWHRDDISPFTIYNVNGQADRIIHNSLIPGAK